MTINNRCLVASAAVGELLSVVTTTERSLSRYFNDVGYLGMHCVFDDIAHQMVTQLEDTLTEVKRLIADTQQRLAAQPTQVGEKTCHALQKLSLFVSGHIPSNK